MTRWSVPSHSRTSKVPGLTARSSGSGISAISPRPSRSSNLTVAGQIAGRIGLDAIGQDPLQQRTRQVRRRSTEEDTPAPGEAVGIGAGEADQLRLDFVHQCRRQSRRRHRCSSDRHDDQTIRSASTFSAERRRPERRFALGSGSGSGAAILYADCPPSSVALSIAKPRLRKPVNAARIVCGSQAVASIKLGSVAPSKRLNSWTTSACFDPSRGCRASHRSGSEGCA